MNIFGIFSVVIVSISSGFAVPKSLENGNEGLVVGGGEDGVSDGWDVGVAQLGEVGHLFQVGGGDVHDALEATVRKQEVILSALHGSG